MFEGPIASWPPYQFFYIESMLTICQSAVASYLRIQEEDENLSINEYLNDWQNIIQQSAALSRYFWPTPIFRRDKKERNEIHQTRGEYLREIFYINDNSPLRSRELRNSIEHFDERIDLYLHGNVAGDFFPNYVGGKPLNNKTKKFFRAYFTDTQEFEVLGKAFPVVPIVEEISRINNMLVKFTENGTFSSIKDIK